MAGGDLWSPPPKDLEGGPCMEGMEVVMANESEDNLSIPLVSSGTHDLVKLASGMECDVVNADFLSNPTDCLDNLCSHLSMLTADLAKIPSDVMEFEGCGVPTIPIRLHGTIHVDNSVISSMKTENFMKRCVGSSCGGGYLAENRNNLVEGSVPTRVDDANVSSTHSIKEIRDQIKGNSCFIYLFEQMVAELSWIPVVIMTSYHSISYRSSYNLQLICMAVFFSWNYHHDKVHHKPFTPPTHAAYSTMVVSSTGYHHPLQEQWDTNRPLWSFKPPFWCPPPTEWIMISLDGAHLSNYHSRIGILFFGSFGILLIKKGSIYFGDYAFVIQHIQGCVSCKLFPLHSEVDLISAYPLQLENVLFYVLCSNCNIVAHMCAYLSFTNIFSFISNVLLLAYTSYLLNVLQEEKVPILL